MQPVGGVAARIGTAATASIPTPTMRSTCSGASQTVSTTPCDCGGQDRLVDPAESHERAELHSREPPDHDGEGCGAWWPNPDKGR